MNPANTKNSEAEGSLAVIVTDWAQKAWVKRFRALAPGRTVAAWPEIADPADISYVAVWKPPRGALTRFPGLKAIFNLGAGVDHVLADPQLPDVPVVRVVDNSLTGPMTEYIVLQVLLHFRQQLKYLDFQSRTEWKPLRQPYAHEVNIGILGLGTLGKEAATKLLGFGFEVAGWSRAPKVVDDVHCFTGAGELDAFLERTDILVSLLPATPDTKGIVNRSMFGKLRADGPLEGPIYINAGRGGTQVEGDIVDALNSGVLAGVSVDVFETEPLDRNSPLWRHPRAVITPHVAADSRIDAISQYVMAQIQSLEAGRPLSNLANRSAGY